jgi:hypothetical protein
MRALSAVKQVYQRSHFTGVLDRVNQSLALALRVAGVKPLYGKKLRGFKGKTRELLTFSISMEEAEKWLSKCCSLRYLLHSLRLYAVVTEIVVPVHFLLAPGDCFRCFAGHAA